MSVYGGPHLFGGVVRGRAGSEAGFGGRHRTGEQRVPARHVEAGFARLPSARLPLSALERTKERGA